MASSSPSQKKIILVTGANQGLGFSIIQVAAKREEGSIFLLGSRDVKKGEEAREKLIGLGVDGGRIEVVGLDITKDEDIEHIVKFITEKYGHLDVLINNAGISPLATTPPFPLPSPPFPPSAPLTTSSRRAAYTSLLSTNLISPYILTISLLPLLHLSTHPSGPKVINITSGLASLEFNLHNEFVRGKRSVEYGSSKTAGNMLVVGWQAQENDRVKVDSLGRKWGEDGKGVVEESGGVEEVVRTEKGYIRFFSVQPGILKTAFTGFRFGKSPEEGAEVAVRLLVDEKEGEYVRGGTYWKCDTDVMEEVPW